VAGAFTGGGNYQGNLLQTTNGIRNSELHFHRVQQALHQVWGTRARVDNDSTDKLAGFQWVIHFQFTHELSNHPAGPPGGPSLPLRFARDCRSTDITGKTGISAGLRRRQPVCSHHGKFAGCKIIMPTLGFYAQDEMASPFKHHCQLRPSLRVAEPTERQRWPCAAPGSCVGDRKKTKQGSPKAVLRAGFGVFYDRF